MQSDNSSFCMNFGTSLLCLRFNQIMPAKAEARAIAHRNNKGTVSFSSFSSRVFSGRFRTDPNLVVLHAAVIAVASVIVDCSDGNF